MKPTRKLSRRSFSKQVAGSAFVGGAFGLLGGRAMAQYQSGLTDQDSGSNSDNACQGRGGPGSRPCGYPQEQQGRGTGPTITGITDRDTGSNSDSPNYGRGGPGSYRFTNTTDSDPGDPVGGGRGGSRGAQTGVTDSDTGSNSDNAGQGRGGYNAISDSDPTDPAGRGRNVREGRVRCTDNDTGQYRDLAGQGRRC